MATQRSTCSQEDNELSFLFLHIKAEQCAHISEGPKNPYRAYKT